MGDLEKGASIKITGIVNKHTKIKDIRDKLRMSDVKMKDVVFVGYENGGSEAQVRFKGASSEGVAEIIKKLNASNIMMGDEIHVSKLIGRAERELAEKAKEYLSTMPSKKEKKVKKVNNANDEVEKKQLKKPVELEKGASIKIAGIVNKHTKIKDIRDKLRMSDVKMQDVVYVGYENGDSQAQIRLKGAASEGVAQLIKKLNTSNIMMGDEIHAAKLTGKAEKEVAEKAKEYLSTMPAKKEKKLKNDKAKVKKVKAADKGKVVKGYRKPTPLERKLGLASGGKVPMKYGMNKMRGGMGSMRGGFGPMRGRMGPRGGMGPMGGRMDGMEDMQSARMMKMEMMNQTLKQELQEMRMSMKGSRGGMPVGYGGGYGGSMGSPWKNGAGPMGMWYAGRYGY